MGMGKINALNTATLAYNSNGSCKRTFREYERVTALERGPLNLTMHSKRKIVLLNSSNVSMFVLCIIQ